MRCAICPHNCDIPEGAFGFCGTRKCIGGKVLSDSYGKVTGMALDPIEKKPLRRFYPGSLILSVGSYGCNMRCDFCQNHHISQNKAGFELISPEKLADIAKRAGGNVGVAFTYNEPVLSYEYILDAAPLIRANGQKVALVSNGQINGDPLEKLLPHVDAWNIDVKAFSHGFYKRYGGDLETTKRTVEKAAKRCHVEVTTLVIPGENDGEDEIGLLADWLAGIDREIPYHLSRFFPRHRMADKPATDRETLRCLAGVAKLRLRHVYVGNV